MSRPVARANRNHTYILGVFCLSAGDRSISREVALCLVWILAEVAQVAVKLTFLCRQPRSERDGFEEPLD